jgi:phosphopantetheine--protein transferase-like protein
MDGSQKDKVVAYLSRLTGGPVSADERIVLRSVQRASLAAWLRKEQITIRGSLVGTSASGIVINELMSGDTVAATHSPGADGRVLTAIGAFAGIGIDIEEISNLPDADDYREHIFYQETFTSREIAYCIGQPNAKASFCGIWAAKEAVVKSGMPGTSIDNLISVEITHDKSGRPEHANCVLSVSHTDHTAVAVCLLTARGPVPEIRKERIPATQTPAVAVTEKSGFRIRSVFLVLLSIAICGAMFFLGRFT